MATRAGSFGFYAVGRQDAANTLDVNALRAELGAKPTVSRIKKWLIDNDMGPNVNKTQLAQWAQGWAEYAVSVTQGEREHRPPAKLPFAQLDGFIVQYVELYDELQHDIHVEGVFPRQLLALGLRMRDINGVFWDFLEESGRTGEETRPGKDVMVKLRRAEEMLRGTGAGRSWEALSRAQDALHYLGHAIEQMEKEPASLYGNLEKETAYRQTAAEGAMEKVTEAEAKKLGDAIGVDWREVFVEELARGIEVESEEHGIGKKKAAQIAYDHLKENENYYSKLKKAGLEAEDVAFYKPGDRVWLPRQNRTGRVESVDTDPSGRVRYDIAYVDRGGERKHVKVAPYEVRPGYMIATEDKACGCAEETGAADYPDMEAAFRGAQSKLDATHMVGRGSSTVVFSPTSKGYVTHHLERGGGSLHWFKGKTVDDLPVGATPIYESAIVDPERMALKRREEKPGVRRAAEGDDDEPAPLTPRLLSAQPMPGTPAYSDWLRLKAEIEKEDEALARHQKRRPLPPPMSQRDIEAARRLQRRIGTVRSRVGMEEAEEGLEASERKNVEKVVAAFRRHLKAKGDSKGTISTDGEKIYSYGMPILWRDDEGYLVLADAKSAPSSTTRNQIYALQRIFATQLKSRAVSGVKRDDRERWRDTFLKVRNQLLDAVVPATLEQARPWTPEDRERIAGSLRPVVGELVSLAGVYNDWLTEQKIPHNSTGRKDPVPFSEQRLADSVRELKSAIDALESGDDEESYIKSRVWRVTDTLNELIYELKAEASGGGRPNIFNDTVESIQRQRAARETAQPNPIDTGDGIPWVKIARDPEQYKAAMKLAERIGPIDDEKKIYELLGPAMLKEDQEVFCVVLLDVRHRVRGVVEAHRGERSRVAANMSDILRAAIKGGAESIVVTHNHPSGKAIPSEADKDLTKAIEKACRAVDIIFVDHVILGNGEYYSFADRKRYKAPKTKSKSQSLAAE